MPILSHYHHFGGRHHETGSVHNALAFQGVKAPHTGLPYSEALLMGLSGGLTFAYFTFAYKGYDPQVVLLTRNTFDPLDRLFSRLGLIPESIQTTSADRAVVKLTNALEQGRAPLVWADLWSLPYNALEYDEKMWGSFPIIVFGYDEKSGKVSIADRSKEALTISPDELSKARGRIKKDRHRMLLLQAPTVERLGPAIEASLRDTIAIFTEKPPKGSPKNFGLCAFENWINALTEPKSRGSWEKKFPAGPKMYAAMLSTFSRVCTGSREDGERTLYADFLDEASILLNKPELEEAAATFRLSAQAWESLGEALLPDQFECFHRARLATEKKHKLFTEQAQASLEQRKKLHQELGEIRDKMEKQFPLQQAEVESYRRNLADSLSKIRDLEKEGVEQLKSALPL